MKKLTRTFKLVGLWTMGAGLLAAGGCLPNNFWADKAGEITNGLIIGALNLLLDPTGIQI
jgi:hypothetical protein